MILSPDIDVALKMKTNGTIAFAACFIDFTAMILEMPAFDAVQHSSPVNDRAQPSSKGSCHVQNHYQQHLSLPLLFTHSTHTETTDQRAGRPDPSSSNSFSSTLNLPLHFTSRWHLGTLLYTLPVELKCIFMLLIHKFVVTQQTWWFRARELTVFTSARCRAFRSNIVLFLMIWPFSDDFIVPLCILPHDCCYSDSAIVLLSSQCAQPLHLWLSVPLSFFNVADGCFLKTAKLDELNLSFLLPRSVTFDFISPWPIMTCVFFLNLWHPRQYLTWFTFVDVFWSPADVFFFEDHDFFSGDFFIYFHPLSPPFASDDLQNDWTRRAVAHHSVGVFGIQ